MDRPKAQLRMQPEAHHQQARRELLRKTREVRRRQVAQTHLPREVKASCGVVAVSPDESSERFNEHSITYWGFVWIRMVFQIHRREAHCAAINSRRGSFLMASSIRRPKRKWPTTLKTRWVSTRGSLVAAVVLPRVTLRVEAV